MPIKPLDQESLNKEMISTRVAQDEYQIDYEIGIAQKSGRNPPYEISIHRLEYNNNKELAEKVASIIEKDYMKAGWKIKCYCISSTDERLKMRKSFDSHFDGLIIVYECSYWE